MTEIEIKYKEIAKKIHFYENGPAMDGMERMGLKYTKNHGVSIINLREIAKSYTNDSTLAKHLRERSIREMRILAEMIENHENVTPELAEYIVKKSDTSELVEQVCMNLFDKLPFAFDKAKQWISSDNKLIASAGFILYSRLAMKQKLAKEELFLDFFDEGIKKSKNPNIHLRKAISRAFRQVGLINEELKHKVIEKVSEIKTLNNSDALIVYEEVVPLLDF